MAPLTHTLCLSVSLSVSVLPLHHVLSRLSQDKVEKGLEQGSRVPQNSNVLVDVKVREARDGPSVLPVEIVEGHRGPFGRGIRITVQFGRNNALAQRLVRSGADVGLLKISHQEEEREREKSLESEPLPTTSPEHLSLSLSLCMCACSYLAVEVDSRLVLEVNFGQVHRVAETRVEVGNRVSLLAK